VVRRDVRGLQALEVRNTAKPTPPPAPPVSDDPGKRIASLVPGDPGYLVTADGSRYFIGAQLPTGHRITQIDKSRVTLELHGQSSTLDL
jgi:type III secretion protein D